MKEENRKRKALTAKRKAAVVHANEVFSLDALLSPANPKSMNQSVVYAVESDGLSVL